ncbi:MAG: hypothetical protein AAGI46_04825 [Planctomycetota bacterium]
MGIFRQLDSVLRGQATRAEVITTGKLEVSSRAMLVGVLLLGAFYGACMGCFNVVSGDGAWLQIVSSAFKVPALFLLTLAVTFPSLYVFNALVGSRLSLVNMIRLIMAAIGVMLAVLAGFGTIVAFFNFTTTSYPFILLLNVAVFTISGILGLGFLLQTLRRLVEPIKPASPPPPPPPQPSPPPPPASSTPEESEPLDTQEQMDAYAAKHGLTQRSRREPGALDRLQSGPTDATVRLIFRVWVVIFALVGAQMSWVLRPFVGGYGPGEFVWFRERGGNFFERIVQIIGELIGVPTS